MTTHELMILGSGSMVLASLAAVGVRPTAGLADDESRQQRSKAAEEQGTRQQRTKAAEDHCSGGARQSQARQWRRKAADEEGSGGGR